MAGHPPSGGRGRPEDRRGRVPRPQARGPGGPQELQQRALHDARAGVLPGRGRPGITAVLRRGQYLQHGRRRERHLESMPIQRIQRDLQAISLHAVNMPVKNYELYGRVLCGLEPNTFFI